ncbi:MAG TPA: hypothetical protein VKP64_16040 [Mycobacteriales bacterium]|nr:hypothetical protein [Mycobacteriales bacterium]
MIMAGEFRRLTVRPGSSGRRRLLRLLLSEYPLLRLLKAWYARLYPRFDLLCFLLPSADLLVERGGGQYSGVRRAEAKRQAYVDVARELSRRQCVLVVDISRDMSLEAVAARVMQAVESLREKHGTDARRSGEPVRPLP